MKTLLLSDQSALQIGLERALEGNDDDRDRADLAWDDATAINQHVEVWRTQLMPQAQYFLERDPQVVAVFIDVPWCGLGLLAGVVSELRPLMGDARLVLMVDRPDDLRFLRKTGVRADLCISKTQPLHELREQVLEVIGDLAREDLVPWLGAPSLGLTQRSPAQRLRVAERLTRLAVQA
ncbi:MAG: hypothetical protein RIQ60_4104 [Pseudomonadota bacterium]|jgi:hypothetical protein